MTGWTPGPPLRDYQVEAVESVEKTWADGHRRCLAVLPTGTGKTTIFAELTRRVVAGGGRVLILVDRELLVRQVAERIRQYLPPTHRIGRVQAGHNDMAAPVVVATRQTLARKRGDAMPRLGALVAAGRADPWAIVVADEAHTSLGDGFVAILDALRVGELGGPVGVGFTATPNRADKLSVGTVWPHTAVSRSTRWAIEAGHLVDVECWSVEVDDLDLAGVRTVRAADGTVDLDAAELTRRMGAASVGGHIARALLRRAGRPALGPTRVARSIVFLPSVQAAHDVTEALEGAGIRAATVVGSTPVLEREAAYTACRAGTLDVLVSVGVLTTGFDLPAVECVVLARPTKHAGLVVQMLGRGLRPSPETGKARCVVLDLVAAAGPETLSAGTALVGRRVEPGGGLVETFELQDEEADPAEKAPREAAEREDGLRRRSGGTRDTEVDLLGNGRAHLPEQVRPYADPDRTWLTEQTVRRNSVLPSAFGGIGITPHAAEDAVTVMLPHELVRALHLAGWFTIAPDMATAVELAEHLAERADTLADFPASRRVAPWRLKPADRKQREAALRLGISPRGNAGVWADAIITAP